MNRFAFIFCAALCLAYGVAIHRQNSTRTYLFCEKLVESYEACRLAAECWNNRRNWATVDYMADLNYCYAKRP